MTRPPAPVTTTDVVVVGAGPVGLLLACELRRAGAQVVLVDRLPAPMTESRASQLSALSAELLHERGLGALLDEAAAEPRGHFAGLPLDLSGLDSAWAGNWKVPQHRTEAVLGERARELGVTVLRGHELTGVTEAAEHVTCVLAGPADEQLVRARFVAGCDGADSTVRRLCGFPVAGTAATKELLRADVEGLSIRDRRFEREPAGFAVAGTRGGITRVMVHVAGRGVTRRAGPPGFDEIARSWRAVTGEDISGGRAIWTDAFDNSRGQAALYRKGRVLLAGDAAHWHLPIGGQALNTGLQDAVNLGWKLAATVLGDAAPGLLDSYHDERHPAGARVLAHVAAQELLLLGGAGVEPLRAVLAELAALERPAAHLARVAANLDDRYGPPGPGPAGRRAAQLRLRTTSGPLRWAGPGPAVVRLGSAPDRPCPVDTIHAAGDAGALPGVTTVLLRPDGYVAWAGDDEHELDLAIGKLLRTRGRNENAGL